MFHRLRTALTRFLVGLSVAFGPPLVALANVAQAQGGTALGSNANWLQDAAYIITGPGLAAGIGVVGVGMMVHAHRSGEWGELLGGFGKLAAAGVGVYVIGSLVKYATGAVL